MANDGQDRSEDDRHGLRLVQNVKGDETPDGLVRDHALVRGRLT